MFSIKILPNLFCPPACVGQTVGKLLHVVDPSCALSQQRNLEKKKKQETAAAGGQTARNVFL